MNETERQLNIFFDDCSKNCRNNKDYIKSFINIDDKDFLRLRTKQPDIDIAELTKQIAILAGYKRINKKKKNGKTSEQNSFDKPFDNSLTCLWFCYYRFLFFRRLCREEYKEIAFKIIYQTFFRFMRYVNIDILNSGKQITTLFNFVLNSNLINEYQQKKKTQKFYEEGCLSYDENLKNEFNDGGINDDLLEDIPPETFGEHKTLQYAIEYLITEMPYEYELHNELYEMLNGQRKELTDFSKQTVSRFMKDKNLDFTGAIYESLSQHEEYQSENLIENN